jgi:hypothetical protein
MLYIRPTCLLAILLFIGTNAKADNIRTETDSLRHQQHNRLAEASSQLPSVLQQAETANSGDLFRQQIPVTQERPSMMDRLYWGGGFGLQFGTFTNVSLSPIIGYKATEKFWLGGGVIYQYRSVRTFNFQTGERGRIVSHNTGGRVFAQQELLDMSRSFLGGRLLAHAEYEVLNISAVDRNTGQSSRRVVTTPMAGLGYRQQIGARATADLYVLYNFSDNIYTPYNNPIVRAGFNFPFRR